MSKKKQETRTSIDELNDQLTSVGEKVQANKKYIAYAVVAVVVLVCAALIYMWAFRGPAIQKGNDAIGQADLQLAMGNDSIALAQYEAVANSYGYAAGNRASLQAAILLYKEGKYQEALKYLDKFDAKESIIGAGAYSLKGDCYVNLNKLDDALHCYDKAISESDDNPVYTPFFMLKEARIYQAKGDYAKEAQIYEKVKEEYPKYAQTYGIDLDRYIERANAQAGK
ncbi:MAG: tetratricopeptide repeat protein [Bacteroidales bacterium]|nr:tetratricopeptide repeat protein [Bacteroidales bacterium]MCD8393361.1 tetratricopeptide repeat protein [Bacteroidales bacterium]